MDRTTVLTAAAAFLLVVAACAPPPQTIRPLPSETPTAPPSPTPTTAIAAAAPSFHLGEVGVTYSPVSFTASGGLAPYKWSVASGALPGGLTLGSDGSISGTPTVSGNFTFTIGVADSGTQSSTADGKISIAAPLTASLISYCSSFCNVELGCVDVCGSFGEVTGGIKPYAFSVAGGALPAGTSLKPDALFVTGTFQGSAGWVQFTAQVTDALGATATVSPKFWMYPHVSLQGSATCYGNYGTGCQATLAISGGIPNSGVSVQLVSVATNPNPNPPNNNPGQCWSIPPPSPPPSSPVAGGGQVTVTIPQSLINGYGAIWTVQVSSADLCGSGKYCVTNQATVTIGVQCG